MPFCCPMPPTWSSLVPSLPPALRLRNLRRVARELGEEVTDDELMAMIAEFDKARAAPRFSALISGCSLGGGAFLRSLRGGR